MLSIKGFSEDASALLYLVPFVASGVYGLYLWLLGGVSVILPTGVYLTVTRDPFLFIVGSLSVMLGLTLEVSSADPAARKAKVDSLGNTLQTIAAASLILALVAAWYANGFTDISGAATDFIVGRFSVVFPAMMVLLSYLVTARFDLSSLKSPKVLGIVAMLLVPATLYAVGRRSLLLGLGGSLILVVIGLVLFLATGRKAQNPERK